MNEQQLAKLRARSEHLLDLFLALRAKYALLRPLAFDEDLARAIGNGRASRARLVLRNALLASCVQDIVKLTLDEDARTPSVANLMRALQQQPIREALLVDYASVGPEIPLGDDEPLPPEILSQLQAAEEARLTADFEQCWSRLTSAWESLTADDRLDSFKTWRDKVIAHADLHHTNGQYHLIDIAELGLEWVDLRDVIGELQKMVELIGVLSRSAGFSWDDLDEQLTESTDAFWGLMISGSGEGAG